MYNENALMHLPQEGTTNMHICVEFGMAVVTAKFHDFLILGHTHAETWSCFGHKMTKE
jgi:hypothetical protein